jgi:hypothetical protein
MNCTVNTSAAKQRSIGCIDDDVHLKFRNVAFYYFDFALIIYG